MADLHLLLITSRPLVHTLFLNLGPGGHQPLVVHQIPADVEALAEHARWVALADVAAVDVAPDPGQAVVLCGALRRQRPALPIAAVVSSVLDVTRAHLQALVGAGAASVIDSNVTGEQILRALQRASRGDRVLQLFGEPAAGTADPSAPSLPGADTREPAPEQWAQSWPESAVDDRPDEDVEALTSGAEAPAAGELPARAFSETDSQILQLVARGIADREIRLQLRLSPYILHHHFQRLYRELHLRNRAELAAWAGRHGYYRASTDDPASGAVG
jgi:DNA-binding NarL/FixJ family response regulator